MEIKIENLKKVFGDKTAVDIHDFTVHDGDMVGLVGNNGAGKTTLFRLILDLMKSDEGEILLKPKEEGCADGTPAINPAKSEDWKKFTGAYIDDGFLIDFLTPEEYFEFIGKGSGMSKEDTAKRSDAFSTLMNGEIFGQKKYIRELSAGNKQKVGIIAALFNSPQLVLLDEPFNFLDPSSQNTLKKLLTDYHDKTGATILVSSHNLQHTVEISSRIALMENGKIIKDLDNKTQDAADELADYFNV